MECSICKTPDNLVYCSKCGISVHFSCYKIAPTEQWRCDSCIADVIPVCSLCPPSQSGFRGVPMRQSRCGQWVHLTCVLYIPETSFEYVVKGIEDVDPLAITLKCYICGVRMRGVCISCANPACTKTFHPMCALISGLKADPCEPPSIYCEEHTLPLAPVRPAQPPYMLREQPPVAPPAEIQTRNIKKTLKPGTHVLYKQPKESDPNNFKYLHAIDDFFARPGLDLLKKTQLPFNKELVFCNGAPGFKDHICRAFIDLGNSRYWTEFGVRKRLRKEAFSDICIIQPNKGRKETQVCEIFLKRYLSLNGSASSQYERLRDDPRNKLEISGKCLEESLKGSDDVTREILYCLKYFSLKVIPTVNPFKDLLQISVSRNRRSMDLSINEMGIIRTQWGFIFRSMRAGLQDKDPSEYSSKLQIIEEFEVSECDCSICFSYNEDEAILNPLLYCTKCRLFVHKYCYGLHPPPSNFVCEQCYEGTYARCLLCGRKGGPMKKAGKEWFHISCALWDCRRVEFEDLRRLGGLRITGETQMGKCLVCGKADGLLTQCKHCHELSHLLCAWKHGLQFYTEELPSTGVRKLLVSFSCSKHSTHRDLDMQSKFRSNPFLYYQKPGIKRKSNS